MIEDLLLRQDRHELERKKYTCFRATNHGRLYSHGNVLTLLPRRVYQQEQDLTRITSTSQSFEKIVPHLESERCPRHELTLPSRRDERGPYPPPLELVSRASGFAGLNTETSEQRHRLPTLVREVPCFHASMLGPLIVDLVKVWLGYIASHWLQLTPSADRGVEMR